MEYESIKKELLKQARNAFETASTLHTNQRIEVYVQNGVVKISDVLEENEEIVYTQDKVLCYTIDGYDDLEDEIKTWIDYARIIQQPTDTTPMPQPTDIELAIRDLVSEIAKKNNLKNEEVNSYEVFANLPVTLLGTIEQQILEYWWSAENQDNAKDLATKQIEEALQTLKF